MLPAIPLRIASLVPSERDPHSRGAGCHAQHIAARQTRGDADAHERARLPLRVAGAPAVLVASLRAFQQRRSADYQGAHASAERLGDLARACGASCATCSSRRRARAGMKRLSARALAALRVTASYAAGQPVAQRKRRQRQWLRGTVDRPACPRRAGARLRVPPPPTRCPRRMAPAPANCETALAQFTSARYGRIKAPMAAPISTRPWQRDSARRAGLRRNTPGSRTTLATLQAQRRRLERARVGTLNAGHRSSARSLWPRASPSGSTICNFAHGRRARLGATISDRRGASPRS